MAKAKTRDPEATRYAILTAAEEVFLERGFGDTPLSLIAKKAGVTKSLIHHHFESKEKLWDEVKHSALCGFAAQQDEIQNKGEVTLETLRETMTAYFRFVQQHPQLVRLMAWMTIENLKERVDICVHDKLIENSVAQIQTAQEKGLVRDDVPAINVLMAFISMVHGWFQDRYMFQKWVIDGDAESSAGEGGIRSLEAADEVFIESAIAIVSGNARPITTKE